MTSTRMILKFLNKYGVIKMKYNLFFSPEEEAQFMALFAEEEEAYNEQIRSSGGMTEGDFYDPMPSDEDEDFDDPVRNGWVGSNGLP